MQAVLGSHGDCQGPDGEEWHAHATKIPCRQRAWKVQQVLVVSQPRRFRGFLLGTWLDTRGDWSVFGSMCGGGERSPSQVPCDAHCHHGCCLMMVIIWCNSLAQPGSHLLLDVRVHFPPSRVTSSSSYRHDLSGTRLWRDASGNMDNECWGCARDRGKHTPNTPLTLEQSD